MNTLAYIGNISTLNISQLVSAIPMEQWVTVTLCLVPVPASPLWLVNSVSNVKMITGVSLKGWAVSHATAV